MVMPRFQFVLLFCACISWWFLLLFSFYYLLRFLTSSFRGSFLQNLIQPMLCKYLFPPLVSFSLSLSVPNINHSHKATNLLFTYKYIANVDSEHKEPLAVGHWFQIYSSSHRNSYKVKSSRQAPCSFHARQNVGVNLNTLRFLLNSLMFINISESPSLGFDLTLIINCQLT